jgi:pimeloyl-ACP methyl ester carboxylesterase
VYLHGYPDTLQIWSALAPLVGGTALAFDWPGLGFSTPWPGRSDPDALAEVLRTLLDGWGVDRVSLVAHDMGGPPALVFAARHPERVERVTVLNSLLFGDAETSWEIAAMRRAGLAGAAFSWAPSVVYDRCIHSFLPPGEVLPDALDADLRGAFSRLGVRRHLAAMCRDYDRALPDLPSRMFGVRCPVSLIWAERDGHFPPVHAERLAALLPNATVAVVPGARHWMAWSRAGEVAALIRGAR